MYAQHGRDLMGCKSPVFSSGTFFGSHHTRWIARKKSTRGEGNCGEVTDRGEEACDARSAVRKRQHLAKTRQVTYRNHI